MSGVFIIGDATTFEAADVDVDGVALTIVIFFFLMVTFGGFWAARWRRPESMDSLDEWGLGGRKFGTVVTWFLLGGDLYTAYTFVAVPAAMFATGAVSGFFAVPYTIVVYPLIFIFMPRMWSVAHRHGYATPADFVRGRYDSKGLSLAVALTGILATMPYIALQLVGIQAILDTIGLGGASNEFMRDLPLFIAFAVLAAFTYSSGLRAPALIAFVKDTLIYLVIVVAIVWVAVELGFGDTFAAAKAKMETPIPAGELAGSPTGIFIPGTTTYWAYASLAFGSALALFMYPHSMTAVLSGKNRDVIRKNATILPAYSLLLGLIALLGFAAIADGTSVFGSDDVANAQLAVPHLFQDNFPSWFAGIAYSAIAIGALVPSAIMSIAAANLFTRNIYKEYVKPDASHADEARVSKIMSLVVKFGALLFVLGLDRQNAINMQLLGGVWILQTFVAIVAGLFTRWFHRWALLAGWAVGMVYGTITAYNVTVPNVTLKLVDGEPVAQQNGDRHFGGPLADFPFTDTKVYIALTALLLNILVAVALTFIFRAMQTPSGVDATQPGDYYADAAAEPLLAPGEFEGEEPLHGTSGSARST
jgi:SSS family solute:Na+ symporter